MAHWNEIIQGDRIDWSESIYWIFELQKIIRHLLFGVILRFFNKVSELFIINFEKSVQMSKSSNKKEVITE